MKLHLPKSLRSALFAAFASVVAFSSSAYADWASDDRCGGYWVYYDGAQAQVSVDTLTLPTQKPKESSPSDWATKMYMCAGYSGSEGQQSTFGKIVAGDGVSLTITANPWQNEKFYSELLIKELEFGGGNGSGSFNIVNTFNGYTGTYETQNVTIDRVLGALTSINNAGVLTLNSATISGNVNNSGTLTLGAVTLSGTASNSGTIILQPTLPEGTESLNLNDYIGNDSQFNAITNSTTGNIVIESSGNKSLSGALALDKGGKVTLKGGTFGMQDAVITAPITSSNTVLGFEDIEAYIGRNGDSKENFHNIAWEIGDGATVHVTKSDIVHWDSLVKWTILTGGVLDMQARQSVNKNSEITLAGGTIKGTGAADVNGDSNTYGLDFFGGGTITVTADSRIETNVGGHNANKGAVNVNFNVSADKVLTMSGDLVGYSGLSFVKQGSGTMQYQGAAFSNALSITDGVFDYNVAKGPSVSHSGAISGAGTFRKSGEGTLTLTGAAGTSSNTLGTLEVTEGVLNLGSAYIANGVDIRGGQLNIGADITLGGAINLAGGVLNLGEGKTITITDLTKFAREDRASGLNLAKTENGFGVESIYYTILTGLTYDDAANVSFDDVKGSVTYKLGTGETIDVTNGYYIVAKGTDSSTYVINAGTVSSAVENATGYLVWAHEGQAAGCLNITSDFGGTLTSHQLLTTTRGNGEIKLATNVSFTDSTTLLFEGTLSIAAGVTLQMGDNEGDTLNFSTLQEIRLDGGNIYYGAKGGKWQHLNVTANSYVHIFDMDTSELKINKVSVAEGATLSINGARINGVGSDKTWNHQLNIDVLTGDGSAVFNGPQSGEGKLSTLNINSLSGFSGNLEVKSYEADSNKYSAVINTGEAGATFNMLKVRGFKTQTFTFVVEGDTKVNTIFAECGISIQLKDSVTLGSFAKEGSGTITLTGSGVYDLGDATKTYDSTASGNRSVNEKSNFTLSDTWTGVVRIQNASHGGDLKKELGLNLKNISRKGSFVELVNVSGFFTDTMEGNLILTKDTAGNAAWTITNGGSKDTQYTEYDTFTMGTFKGSISGDGTMKYAWTDGGAKYSGYIFSGDLSEWTGAFEQAAANKCFNLTLEASAYSVNAEIKRNSNAELHLRVKTNDTATFNKAVNVTKLTLEQGVKFASGGENTVAGDLTVAKDEGKNISLTNDSTLSVTGGLTSDYGLSIAGGAGDITLSGAQNTVNGKLSIASGNKLTLAEGSELNVNNTIQNDGSLNIQGTVNWTLSSAAGLTVEYAEWELEQPPVNRLGEGVISGLITGVDSLEYNGAVTVNGAAGTLDTDTGKVTAGGLVYYVMNSPKLDMPENPKAARVGVVYSFGNRKEVLLDDVVHVGYHTYDDTPKADSEVNNALGYYVGDNGILAIMGNTVDLENPDNIYMTAGDILESAKGTGDIILLTPGHKNGITTHTVYVDSKTHVTGSLYLAPYLLNEGAVSVYQPGVSLTLEKGADISSFKEVRYVYPESTIRINGQIGQGENGAHIKNLSAAGSAAVYFLVNKEANEHLVLGGETSINTFNYGLKSDGKAMEQGSTLYMDINHANSHITIKKLSGNYLDWWTYGDLYLSTRRFDSYGNDKVTNVKGVLDIESFDFDGYITLYSSHIGDSLHVKLTLEDKQEVYDTQLRIDKKLLSHGDVTTGDDESLTSLDAVTKGDATLTLYGSGTYILSNYNSIYVDTYATSQDLIRNFAVLDKTWTGTVEVNRLVATGDVTGISGINPADYGNESSTVHFKGFKGYLTDDTPEEVAIVQNLVLTNALEEKDEYDTTFPAMDAYEISSGVEGQVQNYTGTISGDGDFVVSAAENMTFNLKGDISGWAAEAEETEPPALIVKAGEHVVNFSDNATVINADLLTYTGGTMNAAISNEAAVTVNGVVSHADGGTLNMTVATEQGTTFNNTVDINKLVVSDDSVAQFAGETNIGNVGIAARNSNAAVVQYGMTIEGSSVTGGSAVNAAFAFDGDGSISNTKLTDVSLSSLHSLQEKSSISMENIVATNVYLAGKANFVSLDEQTAFTWEKSVVEYGRTYNEVTFTTYSFKGMILASLAGQITMTVAGDVAEWTEAAADALTNVTIMLEGFRVEGMSDGQRVDGVFKPLTFLYSTVSESTVDAESIMTVEQLLNLDANSYVFVYYEQLEDGLLIRMSNIPEPSTATLSLLALAALAARRRRRR